MADLRERIEVFGDSMEVAKMLRQQGYAQIEAAQQIEGLWRLCLSLYREKERLLRKSSAFNPKPLLTDCSFCKNTGWIKGSVPAPCGMCVRRIGPMGFRLDE